MTIAQVVETSVTVNNNSTIQDYVHPDDQNSTYFWSNYCIMYICLFVSDGILYFFVINSLLHQAMRPVVIQVWKTGFFRKRVCETILFK